MKRPLEKDFIFPEEKPNGAILGYLDHDAYIGALEDYVDYLEDLLTINENEQT